MVDKKALVGQGFALGTPTGGLPRKIYYAPDGTMKGCVPGYLSDGRGNLHDRMLLDGWSLTPPENLKPHCAGCDKWHDTQAEVDTCIKNKKKMLIAWEKRVRKEVKNERDEEIESLRSELDELKGMLKQFLEAK